MRKVLAANLVAGVMACGQAAQAKQFKVVHYFGHYAGSAEYPLSATLDARGTLFGVAAGGPAGHGLIFRYDVAGNYSVVHRFTAEDGVSPSNVIVCGETIYGTMFFDQNNAGLVFSQRKDGSGLQILHQFYNNGDGNYPSALVCKPGGVYGTAWKTTVGPYGGLLYELDGTAYRVLAQTAYPAGLFRGAGQNLILSYSEEDGSGFHNAVLDYDPSTGTTSVIHDFGGSQGFYSVDGIDANGTLFGDTSSGSGGNALFGLQPHAAGYRLTDLHHFKPAHYPHGLTVLRNGDVLGDLQTKSDPVTQAGEELFRYHAGRLVVFHRFKTPQQGVYVRPPLERPDGSFVGIAVDGGQAGKGVIYRFDPDDSTP